MEIYAFPGKTGSKMEDLEGLVSTKRDLRVVPLSKLKVGDDGDLLMGKDAFHMTASFLRRLSWAVRVPSRYILNSPGDVAADNLNYWLPKASGAMKVVTIGDIAAGLLPEDFSPLPMEKLVDKVKSLPLKIVGFTYDDRGLEVKLTTERLVVEPKKGDIIRAGVVVSGSDLFKEYVEVSGLLYRLACLNGATTGFGVMNRRIQRAPGQGGDALLNLMSAAVDGAINLAISTGQGIKRLKGIPVEFENPDQAEARLGNLLREGYLPRRSAAALGGILEAEEDTGYGLFNAISQMGRDMGNRALRGRYERLAGRLVMEDNLIGVVLVDELDHA